MYDLGTPFGPVNLGIQHYGLEGERLGSFLIKTLQRNMDDKGIEYRLNTRGDELLTDEAGNVIGVKVEAPNGEFYNIYADAVVVATGGFFANKEMTALTLMYTVADTLEELAEEMNIDYEGLMKSVEAVQESIAADTPDEFGKAHANMRTDFTNPPYYGVKTQIENHTNYGGIATNYDSKALQSDGTPIDGLYAVGECAAMKAGTSGMLSVGVFEGRIAANAIANER